MTIYLQLNGRPKVRDQEVQVLSLVPKTCFKFRLRKETGKHYHINTPGCLWGQMARKDVTRKYKHIDQVLEDSNRGILVPLGFSL